MTDLQALRAEYRVGKAQILQSLGVRGASARNVRSSLHKLAKQADDTLTRLWHLAGLGGPSTPFSLLGVGGFGRGELFPYSDVDVLVLLPNGQSPETDAALKDKIEAFIGFCWDVGLEIGASVRTLSRLFRQELGMGFAEWRRQVQLAVALSRLAEGQPVSQIARSLGYLPSSFSDMFRRALGAAPGAYVASETLGDPLGAGSDAT